VHLNTSRGLEELRFPTAPRSTEDELGGCVKKIDGTGEGEMPSRADWARHGGRRRGVRCVGDRARDSALSVEGDTVSV
jgi:hypothetical protein